MKIGVKNFSCSSVFVRKDEAEKNCLSRVNLKLRSSLGGEFFSLSEEHEKFRQFSFRQALLLLPPVPHLMREASKRSRRRQYYSIKIYHNFDPRQSLREL